MTLANVIFHHSYSILSSPWLRVFLENYYYRICFSYVVVLYQNRMHSWPFSLSWIGRSRCLCNGTTFSMVYRDCGVWKKNVCKLVANVNDWIKFTKIYCVCTQFSFYKHGTPHSSELVFVTNKRFSTKSKSSRLIEIHFSLPRVCVGHCQVVTRSETTFCRCKIRQWAISNLAMMSLCLHYLVEKCISRRLEDN